AALFFLRARRDLSVLHMRAAGGDRLSIVLNAALPMLVPKIGVRAATLLTALAAAPARSAAMPHPIVVPVLDLMRYSGTWYEIARLPTRHERRCADEVTATYEFERNRLRVTNRCRRDNGRLDVVRGRARVVDPISRAKLKLTFAPKLLRWLPFVWA